MPDFSKKSSSVTAVEYPWMVPATITQPSKRICRGRNDGFCAEIYACRHHHRLGFPKKDTGSLTVSKPRPMIAKFLNRGVRDTAKKTKYSLPKEFGITEDFPREIRIGRSKLIPRMIQAKKDGHAAWIAYPCRLFIDHREVDRIDPASINA